MKLSILALKNENRIDKLDIKIDKLCQRIFALAQPVATDLRFIMSSLRIGNEIERIGDIALDIIEPVRIGQAFPGNPGRISRFTELFAEVISMNQQASRSLYQQQQ